MYGKIYMYFYICILYICMIKNVKLKLIMNTQTHVKVDSFFWSVEVV